MTGAKPFKIAIVGGGLGGLALAIGFNRQSVPFHVYESASVFSEIGAGITFGINAIRALGLLDPDLLTGFRKHFNKNPEGAWMTVRMAVDLRVGNDGQNNFKTGDVIYDQRDEAESGYIHRARLLEEMVKLVPKDTVSFKKTLVDIKELPEERGGGVELHFADGTTARADAVIGCDGIKSPTRSIMAGKPVAPKFTGDYVYRQLVPRDIIVKELGQTRALTSHLLFSYGTVMVLYPVDNGAYVNMVAIHASNESTWDHDAWVRPASKEAMLKDLEGWDPAIMRLMSRMEKIEQWALFDLPHNEKYYRDRICLLGDAAHAATPHNGAGAAMAMEDAYVLSQLLGQASGKKDLKHAFSVYDAVRRPRTQRLIQNSRDSGKTWQLRDEETRDIPSKLKEQLDLKFQWIWYHDLEAEVKQALSNSATLQKASL